MDEPLSSVHTKKLIRVILASGAVRFTTHALKEMEKDNLLESDVLHVLRAGVMRIPAEYEHGSWRYRLETSKNAVVVAFRSESVLVIVTAWRI